MKKNKYVWINCPRCHTINHKTELFCTLCWQPLSRQAETILEFQKHRINEVIEHVMSYEPDIRYLFEKIAAAEPRIVICNELTKEGLERKKRECEEQHRINMLRINVTGRTQEFFLSYTMKVEKPSKMP